MPTVTGMRRRGYTPEAIRNFCAQIGVAKNDNLIDVALLEHCVREDLNEHAPRVMCVLRPLRVVIDNYPENQVEQFECANHPQYSETGQERFPFPGCCILSATILWKIRRKNIIASGRAEKFASETPMS